MLLLCPKNKTQLSGSYIKIICLSFFSIGVQKIYIYKYIKQYIFLVCFQIFVWGVAVLEINDKQIISGKFGSFGNTFYAYYFLSAKEKRIFFQSLK